MDLLKSMNDQFISEIKLILERARQRVYSSINREMVDAYWEIGKRIVEEEQKGEKELDMVKKFLKPYQLNFQLNSEKGLMNVN